MFTISYIGCLPAYVLFTLLLWLFSPSWLFLPLAIMIVLTTTIVYLIKWLYPTKRPDYKTAQKPKYFWERIDQNAFPSAHTAWATALTIILFQYENILLQLLSILFVILVAYSRLALKRHYKKDILGGLIIGIITGFISWHLSPVIAPLLSTWGLA